MTNPSTAKTHGAETIGTTPPTRVLLIDDNEDDALIAQAMLHRVHGIDFEVEWVSTFQQGLDQLKTDSHDICLLDYTLGKETGLDVLGESVRFGCRIPIIMLTGTTDRQVDFQAIKLGAADYVIKGETNPVLLERVIRHAQERRKASIEREQLTQQLLESSRRLGMAEVASDILHNIGNLLNSLNVSAGLIAQQIREMPAQDVNRISALLESHREELGPFLTQDRKGQQLLEFLTKLGTHLGDLHTHTCINLDTLLSQIEQVKTLIAAQHDIAKTPPLFHPVQLKDVVEAALQIHTPGLDKYEITLIRDYADLPQVMTDKQHIMQIVTNLIRNAKEAIRQQGQGSHQLIVRIQPHSEDNSRIRIQVQDSGIGLPPDQLHRIFAQSFRTAATQGGTSLHTNAIAAKNLGGTLTAFSDGEGQGATFILEIPVRFVERPASSNSDPS